MDAMKQTTLGPDAENYQRQVDNGNQMMHLGLHSPCMVKPISNSIKKVRRHLAILFLLYE